MTPAAWERGTVRVGALVATVVIAMSGAGVAACGGAAPQRDPSTYEVDPAKVTPERLHGSPLTIPTVGALLDRADLVVEGTVSAMRVGVERAHKVGGQGTIEIPRLITIDVTDVLYRRDTAGGALATVTVIDGLWYGGRPQVPDDSFWATNGDHVIAVLSAADASGPYAGLWLVSSEGFFMVGPDGERLSQPGAIPAQSVTEAIAGAGASKLRSDARARQHA